MIVVQKWVTNRMRSRKFIVLSPRSSSALPSDLFLANGNCLSSPKKTFTIPDFRKSSSTAHLEKELHGNVSRYQLAFLQSKKEKGEVRFPSGVYPSQDATGHPSYNWKIQIWMLVEHGYTQDYITFSNWFNKTSISSHGNDWLQEEFVFETGAANPRTAKRPMPLLFGQWRVVLGFSVLDVRFNQLAKFRPCPLTLLRTGVQVIIWHFP